MTMTREEAIKILKAIRVYECYPKSASEETKEALDMAIEALSTNGDLISRQWLLDLYGDYIGDNGDPKYHVPLKVVRQNIINAPPANRLTDGEWLTEYDYDSWKRGYEQGELWSKVGMKCEVLADRPSGKWEYCENEIANHVDGYKCSNCGFFVPWDYEHKFINFIEDYNFCPSCRADMRGENK